MPIVNHQYYMTIDSLGLKFLKANQSNESDNTLYRLRALNDKGLKFVAAIKLYHQDTELPVIIAIFEETV